MTPDLSLHQWKSSWGVPPCWIWQGLHVLGQWPQGHLGVIPGPELHLGSLRSYPCRWQWESSWVFCSQTFHTNLLESNCTIMYQNQRWHFYFKFSLQRRVLLNYNAELKCSWSVWQWNIWASWVWLCSLFFLWYLTICCHAMDREKFALAIFRGCT